LAQSPISPSVHDSFLSELLKSKDELIQSQKEELDFLRKKCRAQELTIGTKEGTIEKLRCRLEQRIKIIKKDYSSNIPYFQSLQEKIIQVFLEDSPEHGLTNPEIQKFFSRRFPNISTTYLPRRVYELQTAGKLYRHDDNDGTARYFLTLKPEEVSP
jgi:hypothetical protein